MSLRETVEMLDLNAAINRLVIHGDPEELSLLTDKQFDFYLSLIGDEDAKAAIISQVPRPHPSRDATDRR